MRLSPLALAAAASLTTVALAQHSRVAGGIVLVANQQSGNASIVDVATRSVTTIPVGAGPHEAVISPDGRWGVITIYGLGRAPGNQLAVVDLAAKRVVRTIDLGTYTRPHGAAFLPGAPNTVAVTSETTGNVVFVDIIAGRVLGAAPTRHPGSHMLGVTADGRRLFTASIPFGGVSELDPGTRTFVRDLEVSKATEGIAVAPDGGTVWLGSRTLGTVSVVDVAAWRTVATLTGIALPYRIAISPDGSLAAICDAGDNRIHIVDVRTRAITGTVDAPGSPRGVTIAPNNRTLFVTLGPENALAAIDLVDRTVLWTIGVGTAPDGVWYGPALR